MFNFVENYEESIYKSLQLECEKKMDRSLVKDHGEYSSKCGYCKGKGPKGMSYGMWAERLTITDYQELLNRGWRRSGKHLYKPNLSESCCPPYTIRLKAAKFVPSKAQRKVLRRMERYLNGDYKGAMAEFQSEKSLPSSSSSHGDKSPSKFKFAFPKMERKQLLHSNESTSSSSSHSKSNENSNQKKKLKGGEECKPLEKDAKSKSTVVSSLTAAVQSAIEDCCSSGKWPPSVKIPPFKVISVKDDLRSRLKASSNGGKVLFSCSVAFPLSVQLQNLHSKESSVSDASVIYGSRREKEKEKEKEKEEEEEEGREETKRGEGEVGMEGKVYDFTPDLIAETLAPVIQKQNIPEDLFVIAVKGHLNFLTLNPTDTENLLASELMNEKKTCKKNLVKKSAVVIKEDSHYPFSASNSGGKERRRVVVDGSVRLSNPSFLVDAKSNSKSTSMQRKLTITLAKSSFTEEEFQLYKKYQVRVHGDSPSKVTKESYKRFLVDSPLIPTNSPSSPSSSSSSFSLPPVPSSPPIPTPPACGFGSFHQQYRIDSVLVAVGVIDILTECVSSKYLFWDPDYAFLSLGKYSALQEIDLVKRLRTECPSMDSYYLGYYIHSCHKMRYKASYYPSELLCPLRFQWVPFSKAVQVLNRVSFAPLSKKPKSHSLTEGMNSIENENKTENENDIDKSHGAKQVLDAKDDGSMRMEMNMMDMDMDMTRVHDKEEQMELQGMLESCEGMQEEEDKREGEEDGEGEDERKLHERNKAKVNGEDVKDDDEWVGDELTVEEIQEQEKSIKESINGVPVFVFKRVMTVGFLLSNYMLTENGMQVLMEMMTQYLCRVGPGLGLRMICVLN